MAVTISAQTAAPADRDLAQVAGRRTAGARAPLASRATASTAPASRSTASTMPELGGGARRVLAVVPGTGPLDGVVATAGDVVADDGEVILITVGPRPTSSAFTPLGFMTDVGVVMWVDPGDRPDPRLVGASDELDGRLIDSRVEHVASRPSLFASRRRRFAARALADAVQRLGADIVVVDSTDRREPDLAAALRPLTRALVLEVHA